MPSRQDYMNPLKSLRRRYRFSLLRTLLGATGLMVALQASVVVILQIISAYRKHSRQEGSFPHPYLSEVSLGKNHLQLYDYGRDLYEAMLAAIDAAKESIYLETFIWKDDAV